jgi:serine/threonine-protein kinase
MSGSFPGASGGQEEEAAATPEPRVGNKIGPYRLIKLLGQGSSGRVFEVEHVKIGRRAAMKTLSPEHAGRPGAVKRLFTEALAVNRISNPHIVEVTDLVENGEHHLVSNGRESVSSLKVNALVMELLEGQSMAQAMIGEGPMPPERFLPILAQVAEALAAAHAAGFIHRDLKPENIFLVDRGGQPDFVKLLDFGLTKTLNVGRETLLGQAGVMATADGTFVGTPAYVSPEQASGKPVDHRTDIYGLGVILYEVVCGRLPFEGESVGDFIIKHLTVPPPSLPEEILATKLGRTLDAIIHRCLEKDPGARFPSAGQLAEMFNALTRGEPVQFTAMASYAQAWPRHAAVRRTAKRVAVGAGLGLGLSALAWAMFGGSSEGPPPRAASAPVAAPAPVPAVAVEPLPPPAQAVITFETEPPGAEARLAGHAELLGLTPFQRAFPTSDEQVAVEMSLDGYEPVRVNVAPNSSRTVSVALTRAPPPHRARPPVSSASRRPPGAPRLPGGATEKTIDPFR